MKLEFAKMNPTGNLTVIVRTPVARADQPRFAEALMRRDSVYAEQVGFLEEAGLPGALARLQMMGGEFCGNAAMSLAALIASDTGSLSDGGESVFPLEISGASQVIHCRIRRSGSDYTGTVAMPLPEEIFQTELDPGLVLPVVRFAGIAHVIAFENQMDSAAAKAVIPRWCRQLKTDALGILITDAECSRIRPLVYVEKTGSSVWEQGCGSGTAALGAYLAARSAKDVHLDVSQPGGVIAVQVRWAQNGIAGIEITGLVKNTLNGTAYIE